MTARVRNRTSIRSGMERICVARGRPSGNSPGGRMGRQLK
jgi:hypothetical protein